MTARWLRRPLILTFAIVAGLTASAAPPDKGAAVNHDGRTLPPLPKITAANERPRAR